MTNKIKGETPKSLLTYLAYSTWYNKYLLLGPLYVYTYTCIAGGAKFFSLLVPTIRPSRTRKSS